MTLPELKARLKLFRFRDHHHSGRQNHARREPGLLQAVPRVGKGRGEEFGYLCEIQLAANAAKGHSIVAILARSERDLIEGPVRAPESTEAKFHILRI